MGNSLDIYHRPSHGRGRCNDRRWFLSPNLSSLVPLQLFGQAFVVAITLALLASVLLRPSIYTNLMKWEQGRLGSTS